MKLDPELLKILACPACRARVEPRGAELVCVSCKRRYPVLDGIPDMIVDHARAGE